MIKLENITSLEKAINILEILQKPPYSYKVTELSNLSGFNRTTVHRLLSTLEKAKFVIRNQDTKEFKIGPSIYQMGCIYLNNFNYKDMILKILEDISKETEESVGYAVLEGDTVLSLYEIEINQPLKMNYKPGLYYPINRGCYGKCLMAYNEPEIVRKLLQNQEFEKITKYTLTEPDEIIKEYQLIKEQGYVVSYCEVSSYAIGVGIPVFNSKGQVKACVAVSFVKGNNKKSDMVKIEKMLNILKSYSEEFTKYIL